MNRIPEKELEDLKKAMLKWSDTAYVGVRIPVLVKLLTAYEEYWGTENPGESFDPVPTFATE